MTENEVERRTQGAQARLVREWVACSIAVAAARFIPVPLLDDVVRERATRVAVLRTLRAHGREYPSSAVEPLYAGADSWSRGAFRYLRTVPRRVLLFPWRKYVALFGAAKGVPSDALAVLLLAHTVDRRLKVGGLRLTGTSGAEKKELEREAEALRQAFDRVLEDMDLRLLGGALSEGFSRGRDVTGAAVDYARRTFGRDPDTAADDERLAEGGAGLEPGGVVGEGIANVEQVLRRPEVIAQVQEFDRRVDARFSTGG